MGRNTAIIEISGEKYEFLQFPGKQGTDELSNLLDLLGVSLGKLVAAMGSAINDNDNKKSKTSSLLDVNTEDIDFSKLGDSITMLFTRMHEKKVRLTIERYMAQIIHKGKDGEKGHGRLSESYDVHFQGRQFLMIKVFGAAIKHQFSDFFDAFGGVKNVLEKLPSILGQQT